MGIQLPLMCLSSALYTLIDRMNTLTDKSLVLNVQFKHDECVAGKRAQQHAVPESPAVPSPERLVD